MTTKVAEPGPLITMKIQAVMNRSVDKQGTDLIDIVRLTLDPQTRPVALAQIGAADDAIAADIAVHVDLWLVRRKDQALRWIRGTGDQSVTLDDLDLVAELLLRLMRTLAPPAKGQRWQPRRARPIGPGSLPGGLTQGSRPARLFQITASALIPVRLCRGRAPDS